MKNILILIIALSIIPLSVSADTFLGVYLEDLSQSERRSLSISTGVKVEDTVPGSPAELAGLQADDIIMQINGINIDTGKQVREVINQYQPGDTVELHYLSDNTRKTINVSLAKRRSNFFPGLSLLETRTKHLGLKLQNLTDQLKDFFEVEHGVLVAEVIEDTPAHTAGILAGDILIYVNRQPIENINQLQSIIKHKKTGDLLSLELIRKDDRLDVQVELDETDRLLSFDLNNEIIILGKDPVIDLSELSNWFRSVVPDSTKKELEKQLDYIQEELNRIKGRLQTQ